MRTVDTRAMTLVVMRLRVADVQALQQKFSARRTMKADYGCTSSRLLVDSQDPQSAVVLMDFPSLESARTYCAAGAASLVAGELGEFMNQRMEFLEDVPSEDTAAGL